MRYTNLSFDQIVEELIAPEPYFQKSFLYGEVGNLLLEGGEDAERAEAFFRDLLDSDNSDDKKIALRHLLALDRMDEETYIKLKEFPKKPGNKEIYLEVGEAML